jgi:NAD(P)-dependent dehydrogenase (short-subunit alcohol dehydrogenase family)
MANELSGKVAIVTGGASGIGRGTVEKFLAEGARVVIADIERERGESLAATYGKNAVFQLTDVSQPDQVGHLVSVAVESFGGLHIMVNNAGISGTMHRSFLDDDLADFHRIMAVNVLGVMAGTKHAAHQMAATGGGSIINVSSIGGVLAGGGVMTYRASKAAVIHFTKCAAIEFAQYEVRVNCITPGNIPTPLLASSTTDMDKEAGEEFVKAARELMRRNRPLPREGTPDDIAEAALYFAGDRSAFVTGTVLPVDGGTVAGQPIKRRTDAASAATN